MTNDHSKQSPIYTLQPVQKSPATKSNGCGKALATIGVFALFVVGLLALVLVVALNVPSYADTSPSSHRVIYKATTDRPKYGDCFGFDATYEMPSGTSQQSGGACGVTNSVVVDERTGQSGDFVYLSIQNDEWSAKIGCEIYIDGRLVFQTHSEGQYVIASCSGSIP